VGNKCRRWNTGGSDGNGVHKSYVWSSDGSNGRFLTTAVAVAVVENDNHAVAVAVMNKIYSLVLILI
jgi:hypothetical protein